MDLALMPDGGRPDGELAPLRPPRRVAESHALSTQIMTAPALLQSPSQLRHLPLPVHTTDTFTLITTTAPASGSQARPTHCQTASSSPAHRPRSCRSIEPARAQLTP